MAVTSKQKETMGDFRKLKVWQVAKEIAVDTYKLVEETPRLKGDFRLASQLTSSAVSIVSNIAEGDELDTIQQGIKHFYYSKGSAAELITQLMVTKEIGFIEANKADKLIDKCDHVSIMLRKLITARTSFKKSENR